jgi:hypothetical protein
LFEKFRCDVTQLIELNLFLFGRDLAENGVVYVPGLVDVGCTLCPLVPLHPREGIKQVASVPLIESDFIHGLWLFLHNRVVRLDVGEHSLAVVPAEVDSAGFFNGFLPSFG